MNAARRSAALFGSSLVLALGLVVVFASGGSAASGAICPATGPSCIVTSLFPHFLSVGGTGLVAVKFTNRATATATHTAIAVDLPSPTTVLDISTTGAASATCDEATVTCSFGSVPGRASVKMFVTFSADGLPAPNPATAAATVSFDEGNSNTGSPSNDTFTDESPPITVVDNGASTAIDGRCGTDGTVHGSTNAQGITSTVAQANGLPCGPVDVGIDLGSTGVVSGSLDRIAFVELPTFADGSLADVTYDLADLPQGTSVNKFKLFEVPGYPASVGPPSSFLLVPPCDGLALPDPKAGQATDACVYSRAKFGSKGIELKLKVLGQGIDPGLWG